MLQAILPAVFGLAFLGIAAESVRRGQTKFRGMYFARHDRPAPFWLAVGTYLVMGLLRLAGAAWIFILSSREHEPNPQLPQTQSRRVSTPSQ
jgi:hypothetical protein